MLKAKIICCYLSLATGECFPKPSSLKEAKVSSEVVSWGGCAQAGSLTEAKISYLGQLDLGFVEQICAILQRVFYQGVQIPITPKMTLARIKDGKTSVCSCPLYSLVQRHNG